MKYGLIYMYKNLINNKVYIGQTIQSLKTRRYQHLKQNSNDDFHNDLINLTEKNFEIKVLENNIKKKNLNERENFWIEEYKRKGYKLYNTNSPPYQNNKGNNTPNKKVKTTIYIEKLPITAKPIKGAINHWIDVDGSVYCLDERAYHKRRIIKKVQQELYGYKVCSIKYPEGMKTKRVHKLVAEAFIPNPNNYPIVGHRNNIKKDCRADNLYWTTIKENTQKAVDDGLLVNKSGYDDSQSKPVNMYETKTNKLLKKFGSITEASKETGINKTTISRQAKYKRPVRKEFYFRYQDDEDCIKYIIGKFDYDSDVLIETFVNMGDAERKTKVADSTINCQIKNGKPKYKTKNFYFKLINIDKCEQTIES